MPAGWQVFILDALSEYEPRDAKDAEETIERVTPRLQHANCAVVLSAVKVHDSSPPPTPRCVIPRAALLASGRLNESAESTSPDAEARRYHILKL